MLDNAIAAARITRLKGGKLYALHVLMQYGTPLPADQAIERARAGKTVFVRREDVHRVLDALGEATAETR